MKLQYLKESIFLDLEDNLDNDISLQDIENNTKPNSGNQHILNSLINKNVSRYLDEIFSTEDMQGLRNFSHKNLNNIFDDVYDLCIFAKRKDNDVKKVVSQQNNVPIFCEDYSKTKFVSKSGDIRLFFESILKQLFNIKSNNTIIYNYDIDLSILQKSQDALFLKLYRLLILLCSENYYDCFEKITRPEFLKQVTEILLDFLVFKKFISDDYKNELINKVDWKNSKVIFHLKNNITKNFYNFSFKEYIIIFSGAANLRLQEVLNNLKNKIEYFDFSEICSMLDSHIPKIDFGGFDYCKNQQGIKYNTFVDIVVYYTKIIGLITNTKTQDVFIDVYCPSKIFYCDLRYSNLIKRRKEQNDTLEMGIRAIHNNNNCLNVNVYNSLGSYE